MKIFLLILFLLIPTLVSAEKINIESTKTIPILVNISNNSLIISFNNTIHNLNLNPQLSTIFFNYGFSESVDVKNNYPSNISLQAKDKTDLINNFSRGFTDFKAYIDDNLIDACLINIKKLTEDLKICQDKEMDKIDIKLKESNEILNQINMSLDQQKTDTHYLNIQTILIIGFLILLLIIGIIFMGYLRYNNIIKVSEENTGILKTKDL